MRQIGGVTWLLAGACCVAMACGHAASAPRSSLRVPTPPALERWIDAYVEAADRDKPAPARFSGFIGVARDGVWQFQRGYRVDATAAVPDADTRFRIASMSKMFTAVAIMQLRDQGRLSLEDPVGKYVPGLGAGVAAVKLKHLLSHRSGITSFTDDEALMKTWMNPHGLDEVLATFKDLPLRAEPGTEFDYSNSNYLLLGLAIKQVELDADQFYCQHVLTPARMSCESARDTPTAPNTAAGHTLDESGARVPTPVEDPLPALAGGVMRSTANELLAWDQALATGSVLKPQSQQELMTPHTEGNPAWLREELPIYRGYGYGFNLICNHEREAQTHSGGMAGFTSHFVRIPSEGWLIVVLSDNDKYDVKLLSAPIMEMVLRAKPAEVGKNTAEPCAE